MVGTFCLAFTVIITRKFDPVASQGVTTDTGYNGDKMIGDCIILIYISILIVIFISSMGVKPARIQDFFKILSIILGLFQFYILYLTVSFLTGSGIENETQVVAAVGGTIASFALIVILNCET